MKTDVLILGAGLAGLRAAWAALTARPDAKVHVAALEHGPTGSSFANRNNRLGMRVPTTDAERDETAARIMEAASPGFVDEKLVRLMCQEAEERFMELSELGFNLDKGLDQRVRGCFNGPDTAVIIQDLADAFTRMRTRVQELGGKFITGHDVMGLLVDPDGSGVHGAWLSSVEDGRILCICAGTVVLALGGAANLFPGSLAGPAVPGHSLGLLAEAGAKIENAPYMQAMWTNRSDKRFRTAASLIQPGTQVRGPEGTEIVPADSTLLPLVRLRDQHCPAAYGQADEAVDLWLLERADADGCLEVRPPDSEWTTVRLAAHAANGGAVIDGNGYTGVPGLFACGECATGMHGANRLGGAMVTATQVFGRRAGQGAALSLAKRERQNELDLAERCFELSGRLPSQHRDDFEYMDEIGEGLQAFVLYHRRQGLDGFRKRLDEIESNAPSRRVELAAKTARILAG